MSDLVSSISGTTGVWGQPTQQDPETQTTTSETSESTTSSSSDTSTTSTQPTTSETSSSTTSSSTTSSSTTSTAAPSGSATASNSAPTNSMTAEVSRMPQRLRDLIVQQRTLNSPAATALRTFADQMESDRVAANDLKVEKSDLVQKTKQQIVEQASKALVAQANQTRDSVRALLEV